MLLTYLLIGIDWGFLGWYAFYKGDEKEPLQHHKESVLQGLLGEKGRAFFRCLSS